MMEMHQSLSEQLYELKTLSRERLLDLWRELYGTKPPSGIRREIFVSFLSYRLQENVYGGLPRAVRAELLRVSRSLQNDKPLMKGSRLRQLRPGTRIIRQWKEENHEVFVIEQGYEYRGDRYHSLSHIARKITGTRWSGPAFFGLVKSIERPRRQHV